jgi:hypothetical protein
MRLNATVSTSTHVRTRMTTHNHANFKHIQSTLVCSRCTWWDQAQHLTNQPTKTSAERNSCNRTSSLDSLLLISCVTLRIFHALHGYLMALDECRPVGVALQSQNWLELETSRHMKRRSESVVAPAPSSPLEWRTDSQWGPGELVVQCSGAVTSHSSSSLKFSQLGHNCNLPAKHAPARP